LLRAAPALIELLGDPQREQCEIDAELRHDHAQHLPGPWTCRSRRHIFI
jgi:hypothetical protein